MLATSERDAKPVPPSSMWPGVLSVPYGISCNFLFPLTCISIIPRLVVRWERSWRTCLLKVSQRPGRIGPCDPCSRQGSLEL